MKLTFRPARAVTSVASLKSEADFLKFAFKSSKTPWYAKAGMGLIIAYLISPVDVVPDSIPLLGYLDDLVLIPLGFKGTKNLIPKEVYADYERHLLKKEAKRRLPFLALTIAVVVISMIVVALTR